MLAPQFKVPRLLPKKQSEIDRAAPASQLLKDHAGAARAMTSHEPVPLWFSPLPHRTSTPFTIPYAAGQTSAFIVPSAKHDHRQELPMHAETWPDTPLISYRSSERYADQSNYYFVDPAENSTLDHPKFPQIPTFGDCEMEFEPSGSGHIDTYDQRDVAAGQMHIPEFLMASQPITVG